MGFIYFIPISKTATADEIICNAKLVLQGILIRTRVSGKEQIHIVTIIRSEITSNTSEEYCQGLRCCPHTYRVMRLLKQYQSCPVPK